MGKGGRVWGSSTHPPLSGKGPGQVPDTTYTAQCNGVKGFPSRYANGLCSSNNSRQSSCPGRREGRKHISARPAVLTMTEREGTEGSGSCHIPRAGSPRGCTRPTCPNQPVPQHRGSGFVSSLAAKLLHLRRFLILLRLLKDFRATQNPETSLLWPESPPPAELRAGPNAPQAAGTGG